MNSAVSGLPAPQAGTSVRALPEGVRIRPAEAVDIDQLVKLRMELFTDLVSMNKAGPDAAISEVTQTYFSEPFGGNDCYTWVAELDQRIIATGSLALFRRPPYPGNLQGIEAYVLNMNTLEAFRGKGLGRAILHEIMRFSGERQYTKVWLHASEDGRALYASEGFETSDKYMEWEPR